MRDATSFRRMGALIFASIYSGGTILAVELSAPPQGEQVPLGGRNNSVSVTDAGTKPPVIVIGFVGGLIRHDDPVHSEVQLAARLRKAYPSGVDVETIESYRGENARKKILSLLDTNQHGDIT